MLKMLARWIGLAPCLLAASVWGQAAEEIEPDAEARDVRWEQQFWLHLESSPHAKLRTAAAIRLKHSGDPAESERGNELIRAVLGAANPDPASLWLLASDCRWGEPAAWCEPGGVFEKLAAADPDNAAVTLLRFSQLRHDDPALADTEITRQLLLKAARADRFDAYWGRNADLFYAAALDYVSKYPAPPLPETEGSPLQGELSPPAQASLLAAGALMAGPLPGFVNLFVWCETQAVNQRADGIVACRSLARTLRDKGYSLLARRVGHGIEKTLLRATDPEDPEIQMWQARTALLHVMQLCYMPEWQRSPIWNSESKTMNWARNLSERGEWEGNRLTAFQEYSKSPEDFAVNPAECDRLKGLDDEAIVKFINGRQATEVWNSLSSD